MLPLNPFVVVADAAPSKPRKEQRVSTPAASPRCAGSAAGHGWRATARTRVVAGVRQLRRPEPGAHRRSYVDPLDEALETAPVWPFGLGFLLLAGAGAAVVAGRRLRTPIRRLPNGTRIA